MGSYEPFFLETDFLRCFFSDRKVNIVGNSSFSLRVGTVLLGLCTMYNLDCILDTENAVLYCENSTSFQVINAVKLQIVVLQQISFLT